MPTVTLLEKLYGNISLKMAESQIRASCEGLKVTVRVTEATGRGWLRLWISGEDEVAALNLLEKEIGIAPTYIKNIREGNIYGGKIISFEESGTEMPVDIGAFFPKPMIATVSLKHLQSQLVDGRRLPLRRLSQLFCFLDNSPLEILIKRTDTEQRFSASELSERQILLISSWIASNLDRLVILGACLKTVQNAVRESGHLRDIVEIEHLGMLEHAIVCKLGTNAVGLIPRFGRLIPNAVFGVFSPTEILLSVKA
jgi:hypothetical protein